MWGTMVHVHVQVVALTLILAFHIHNVASSRAQPLDNVEVSPEGGISQPPPPPHRRSLFTIVAPKDRQEFHTSTVPIEVRLGGDESRTANKAGSNKICWKLIHDSGCYGLSERSEADSSNARRMLAQSQRASPYSGCSSRQHVRGMIQQLAAACWVFQFDYIGEETVLDTELLSIDVATVDERVSELYPDTPRLKLGGTDGMVRYAASNRGMGMVLEFGLGVTTMQLSKHVATAGNTLMKVEDEMLVHSFDSLQGLPETWREGFERGRFSMGGTVPQSVRELANVVVHAGLVNETLQPFLEANPVAPVGLLLLDLCLESSTSYVLDQLACRLNGGSIVLLGSFFNFPGWEETLGERSAWISGLEKWGIQFELLGYHSTFLMLKIMDRPLNCPGMRSIFDNDDPQVRLWIKTKIERARNLYVKDPYGSYGHRAVQELEEVISADPFNAEALNLLGYAVKDIRRIAERFEYARRALTVRHRMPRNGTDPVTMLTSMHRVPSFEHNFVRKVRLHRLRHDVEQLQYLLSMDRLPRDLAERAIAAYTETMAQFGGRMLGDMVTLSWEQWATLGPYFNRALYVPVLSRVPGNALNPAIDFTEVQESYQNSDPHLVVVDDFFSDETLSNLLRYYQEATIYYDWHHGSYLGSYTTDGCGNPILAQVIEELTEALRPILCDRSLVQGWVYKYDETIPAGIDVHADEAAVNFNIWLGENMSVDPDHGGLVVYTVKPPKDWSYEMFASFPLAPEVVTLLDQSGYKNITIPYKQNRMVMFDSQLFHASDISGWKAGYKTRRINLTLLFGQKGSSCEG